MKYVGNETNQKKCKKLPNFVLIQLRYAGFTKNVGISSGIILTVFTSAAHGLDLE